MPGSRPHQAKADRPRWLEKSPSKEEFQSLNEELTALNSQLQETLERQRTTSNDLQNVLYSTDVATIFLDTRAQHPLLHAGHQGAFQCHSQRCRPAARRLSSSLAADGALLHGRPNRPAGPQRRSSGRSKRRSGAWYIRRILPYRTQDDGVEGVVITFADITERRHTADALDGGQAAGPTGQRRQVALSRCREP